MSATSTPVVLALGATTQVPNPTAQWGNPAAAVQVQNSSAFLVDVNAGGEDYTIQPFTAQTFPLPSDGVPIAITAVENPSSLTGATHVTVVWLLNGEGPPMQDGPLTAAAIVSAITGTVQSPVQEMFGGTVNFGTTVFNQNFTASANLQGVRIVLFNQAALLAEQLVVHVLNLTTGYAWEPSNVNILPGALVGTVYINVPMSANAGDVLEFVIQQVGASGQNTGMSILGVGQNTVSATAPGGPMGEYQVGGVSRVSAPIPAATTTSVLAAPPAGLAYRLHRFTSNLVSAANGFCLEGNTTGFLYGTLSTNQPDINLDGQMVVEGISFANFTAAAVNGYLSYDLVTIPAIL